MGLRTNAIIGTMGLIQVSVLLFGGWCVLDEPATVQEMLGDGQVDLGLLTLNVLLTVAIMSTLTLARATSSEAAAVVAIYGLWLSTRLWRVVP